MSPIVRGAPTSAKSIRRVSSDKTSDFHYLGFFRLEKVVDLRDEVIVLLLQIFLGVLHIVFTDAIELLELVATFGSRMTNSNPRFFGEFVHDFDELSAPLFVEHRKRNANR